MINVGEYKVTYSVASTNNYDGDTKEVKVIISPLAVSEPTLKGTYTYNGKEQTVELNGLESFMTIASGNKGTNAGSYELVVTLDNNHVWEDGSDGKIAWNIEKATYDMSGVNFSDLEVTYDGNEHILEIEGELPEGVSVSYTTNKLINVGTIEVVASFTGNSNYHEIADMKAVLTISKATYDMSGVSFNDVTVTYDGSEHEVVLDGTLPSGVTVTYSTNKGTNVGTYNAVATFAYDTENYNVIENKTATLTINKAKASITVDTNDINVIYGDTITLPEGTTNCGEVVVTRVDMINVGEYKVTYSVASTNNYDGDTKEVKVIISPLAVSEPTLKGTYTYNGKEQTVELNGLESFMTIASGNKGTNAGSYELVVTLDNNHVWEDGSDGKIAWNIEKATYDMSGVNFSDLEVTYDGNEHILEIEGELPEGVSVSYTTNKLINVGTIEVVASFTGNSNYHEIADMKAMLTIKANEISDTTNEDSKDETVIIKSENGFDADVELVVEVITDESKYENISNSLRQNEKIHTSYNLKLLKNGTEMNPEETLEVKILIPEELKGQEFRIVINNNETVEMEYSIDGDYVVLYTNELNEIAFVYEQGSLIWLIIMLSILSVIGLGGLLFQYFIIKNNEKNKKLTCFAPILLISLIPNGQIIAVIVLGVIAFLLLVLNVLYYILKLRKGKNNTITNKNK